MPEPVLPIEVQLRLFALRDACEDYAKVAQRSPVASSERQAALRRIQQIRAELDPVAPDASGLLPSLIRAFEESTLAEAMAKGDTSSFDRIWRSVVARVHTDAPKSPRAAAFRAALQSLEGPQVDFIESFPLQAQARDVAKEIAALAPQGGSIYLGVDDDGRVVGLALASRGDIDAFDLRIRGVAEKSIDPPVRIQTHWLAVGDAIVVEIEIPPSREPIHCVDKITYIRDGSASRPARQVEILRAVREYNQRQPLVRLEPAQSSFTRNNEGRIVQTFAHVRIISLTERICWKTRASARFFAEGGEALFDEPMPLLWSSNPQPVSFIPTSTGIQLIADPTRFAQGYAMDLTPGDGEVAAVAIKYEGDPGAWGWTGDSFTSDFRPAKWRLPPQPLIIEVTVRADGQTATQRFRLDPSALVEAFAFGSVPDEE